jgi:hypothetical protein
MSPRTPRYDISSSRVIDKQAMPVHIETADALIEGNIHVMINHRPSDVLNDSTSFIALTDVTLTPRVGSVVQQHAFIALNKASIVFLRERTPTPRAQ